MRDFPDITTAEYHNRPEISSGGIRCFATDGPLMYHAQYVEHTVEKSDSDSKRLGRGFHALMENPEAWRECFAVIPTELEDDEDRQAIFNTWNGRTTSDLWVGAAINLKVPAHRDYVKAKQKAAADAGKDFVQESDLEPLKRMAESVYENPAALEYLGAKAEVACISEDADTGLATKALADLWLPERSTVVDFKSTRRTTANAFINDAFNLSYPYQAAHYLKVFEAETFVFISVRNKEPWESMVYSVPATEIARASELNLYYMRAIKGCIETDSWHSLYWGASIELTRDDGRYAQ